MNQNLEKIASACLKCKNTQCKKMCIRDSSIAVAISLYTGLRIGEICALKWEDINFEDNYISVSYTHLTIRSPLSSKI